MADTELIASAIGYAEEAHRKQLRKGTQIPYLSHVVSVAALVLEHGGDIEQAAAGALHDTIEDSSTTAEDLRSRFGDRVASIVVACTDTHPDDGPKNKTISEWLGRKRRYVTDLESEPADAVIVTACDKLHNARAIVTDLRRHGPETLSRFTGRRLGTLWYYDRVAETLASKLEQQGESAQFLASELRAAVNEMARLSGSAAPESTPSEAEIERDVPRPVEASV